MQKISKMEGKHSLNHVLFSENCFVPPPTINDWFFDVADLLRPLYFRSRDLAELLLMRLSQRSLEEVINSIKSNDYFESLM